MVGFAEAAGGGKGGEALVEGGGADAAARAQFGEWQRAVDVDERSRDALVEGSGSRRLRGWRFDDLERESIGALSEFERHARHGRSGAVLDGQGDIAVFAGIAVAAEVKVGIAPGMELGGASQGLTGADVAGALLGVVDDDDGDGVAALQLAQIGEQRRHFAAGVLIDAVQAHEGIEDEQARAPLGDGRIEASAVGLEIEPHGGRGDDLDVEIGEAEAGSSADAVEPPAHDVERVLGGVKQNAPGAGHGEATQARNACRDRDGEVEGKEGFAALGLAADDPDRLLGPEAGDEPALVLGAIGEAPGGLDGQQVHRRRPAAALAAAAGGAAHVSRNSFSSICRASRSVAYASNSPAMFMRARRLPWA